MKGLQATLSLVLLPFLCCKTASSQTASILWKDMHTKTEDLSKQEKNFWHLKDILTDTIPGISLLRAEEEGLIGDSKREIVIAVLDTEMDIEHKNLAQHLWKNPKEIKNGKDDDGNGYVDDVNGWNFLGNTFGENVIFSNDESVRIIRGYEKDSARIKITSEDYEKAKKEYQKGLEQVEANMEYVAFLRNTFPKSKNTLKTFFPKEDYTITQLDSLYSRYKEKDKELARLIYYMADYLKYELSEEWIDTFESEERNKRDHMYNMDYDDRSVQGDDPYDLEQKSYGNGIINGNLDKLYHGTEVAGLIASKPDTVNKIRGICDSCKLMPVCISANGNEHDKDIALGIRYAVDNKADIINMSFGKALSLNSVWVLDALKYASDKGVLVISSAGNSNYNLNEVNDYYPNDNLDNGTEFGSTFILVGSNSNKVDENLRSRFSNYGNYDVDLFAPGEEIITTMPFDTFKLDSGTSLSSALVSGTAALVWSRFPELHASELKEILLKSGVAYDVKVKIRLPNKAYQWKAFDTLSKSGKIVNVYNAFLMADEMVN